MSAVTVEIGPWDRRAPDSSSVRLDRSSAGRRPGRDAAPAEAPLQDESYTALRAGSNSEQLEPLPQTKGGRDADSAGARMGRPAQRPPTGRSLRHSHGGSRWSPRSCEPFIPPPLPPPLFPPIQRKAELMVDITEHITGLKGEKGCRGPRGSQGRPGVKGQEGELGAQGSMGRPGQKGEKGDRGWRGLYGDIGTPGMIKGVKGRNGFRGDGGLKGRRGASGEKGERGIAGAPGEKVQDLHSKMQPMHSESIAEDVVFWSVLFQGDPGQWGGAGHRGEQGSRGKPGGRGTVGLKGSRGPPGQLGYPGPGGLRGLTGDPGLPGQVYVLPGLQGEAGNRGPSAKCSCSQVQTPEQLDRIPTIFIADGEKQMRRLRGENVMVLRTDRKALYIYSKSQWINVLEGPRH
ncbi:hypothetical protein Q5P01_013990 [Channa striata]|uniref:Uncharacterized protein n=1 Tax=Channa striata TaxID=64152 RepID=A0AA88MNE8_CHASR|nr:hypothetical protein Q5P01_013990 [Channa striata]